MAKNFIDSHAHLSMLHDLENALKRAKDSGIEKIICVSTCKDDWEKSYEIANKYSFVFWSFGLHCHHSDELNIFFEKAKSIDTKKCVAIGECGLDYYRMFSKKEIQLNVFEKQLFLAKKLNLPLIIHCRNAFDDVYQTLSRIGLGERYGVMHCFTGTISDARKALDLGLKISFSGIITFEKSKDLKEVLRFVPINSILVETDSPFLSPVPKRGEKNEPSFLCYTVKYIAELLNRPIEEISDVIYSNTVDFFGLES